MPQSAMKLDTIPTPLVDALVTYAADERLQWHIPADAGVTVDGAALTISAKTSAGQTAIGQILLEQNAFSLEAAYGSGSELAVAAFQHVEAYKARLLPAGTVDAAEAVRAATVYEEQASLSEAWNMSIAAWILAGILAQAARSLAGVDRAAEA